MSLQKRTYVDNETIITAENLNAIQDEIIAMEEPGAIDTNNLANGAVTTEKIASLAVGEDELADGAVTTRKIADDAVTSDKLATDSVTSDAIASGAVDTAEINDQAVTNTKIAGGAVSLGKLSTNVPTYLIGNNSSTGIIQINEQAHNDTAPVSVTLAQTYNKDAIDAKETALNDALNVEYENSISDWEQGGFRNTDGVENPTPVLIRRTSYIEPCYKIKCDDGYMFRIYVFNASDAYGGYILADGTISFSASGTEYIQGEFALGEWASAHPTLKYKISFAKTDVSNITTAEYFHLHFVTSMLGYKVEINSADIAELNSALEQEPFTPVIFTSGVDLNNYCTANKETYKCGYYRGDASAYTFANLPTEITGLFFCIFLYSPSSAYTIQIVTDNKTGISYIRDYQGIWGAWKTTLEAIYYPTLLQGGDLDNYCTANQATYKAGSYRGTASGGAFSNLPSDVESLFLFEALYAQTGTHTIQIVTDYITGKIYTRNYAGGWGAWHCADDGTENNIIYSYTNALTSAQGENVGDVLTVMSYNVANYNNDSATYIPTAKQINFKKMISEIKPDFIGLQEDRSYITGDTSVTSLQGIYNPVFPYEYDDNQIGAKLRTKYEAISTDAVSFSNGRSLEFGLFTRGEKTLLFGSVHMIANYNGTGYDSSETISARATQYEELCQWLNGDITLLSSKTNTQIYCPQHDWFIICGDMNTITAQDKTNLKTAVDSKSFVMANGGWLGWIETALRYSGDMRVLDNIIVSENVIINSIKSHTSLYDDLYSDHVPFEANVTLT